MKLSRNTLWIIPLLIILAFPFWSVPVGKFLTPRGGFDPAIKKKPEKAHNFKLDQVRITQNQRGKNTALIRADKARTGDNPNILLMENVDADIFDEEGNITKINAEKGKIPHCR